MNEDSLIIKLKISPNASKNEIIKNDNEIKVKITAQPIENKANKALVEFLSKKLKVAKSNIEIVKGETSKEKTPKIPHSSCNLSIQIIPPKLASSFLYKRLQLRPYLCGIYPYRAFHEW